MAKKATRGLPGELDMGMMEEAPAVRRIREQADKEFAAEEATAMLRQTHERFKKWKPEEVIDPGPEDESTQKSQAVKLPSAKEIVEADLWSFEPAEATSRSEVTSPVEVTPSAVITPPIEVVMPQAVIAWSELTFFQEVVHSPTAVTLYLESTSSPTQDILQLDITSSPPKVTASWVGAPSQVTTPPSTPESLSATPESPSSTPESPPSPSGSSPSTGSPPSNIQSDAESWVTVLTHISASYSTPGSRSSSPSPSPTPSSNHERTFQRPPRDPPDHDCFAFAKAEGHVRHWHVNDIRRLMRSGICRQCVARTAAPQFTEY